MAGNYNLTNAPTIQYVTTFPTSGLIDNSLYITPTGEARLWTNLTSGWIQTNYKVVHELTSGVTSSELVDGKSIYNAISTKINLLSTETLPVSGINNTFYVTSEGATAVTVDDSTIRLSYEIVDLLSSASLEQVPNTYAVSAFLVDKIKNMPDMLIPVVEEEVQLTGSVCTIDMTGRNII